MSFNFNLRLYFQLIILLCLSSLSYAFYIEYIDGYAACILCKIQRLPYVFALVLGVIGYIKPLKLKIIALIFVVFFISLIISTYHVSIELGLVKSLFVCTDDNLKIFEKKELLENMKLISPDCKNVNFRLFGASLATINLIISFVICLISYYLYKNAKN